MFSFSFVKVIVLNLVSVAYAAQFHLPQGTPGFVGQTVVPFNVDNPQNCEKVTIPGTACDLFFPIDGSQPTTVEAGRYSGARYNGLNNDAVTDWWIRVFGGNGAVNLSYLVSHADVGGDVFKVDFFGASPVHIISVSRGSADFEQSFWRTFRKIAADPVGRVLLYRLLIEIRRLDDAGQNSCCGSDVVLPGGYKLTGRNGCRGVGVVLAKDGCSFSPKGVINFIKDDRKRTTTLKEIGGNVTTSEEARTSDVALFHEMLHWFHLLRNPNKHTDSRSVKPTAFKYAMRCYYGYPSELCAWGKISSEEMATILGSPDLDSVPNPYAALIHSEAFPVVGPAVGCVVIQNHGIQQYISPYYKYLSGDDLSENAYRASQGQHMRFGHVSGAINPVLIPLPDRFCLAHKVAWDCYQNITGNAPQNWELQQGQSIQ